MKHSIFDVCTPRQSTFDQDRRDVVLQLSNLFDGKYSEDTASAFFEENFVTNGMKVLVNKAFERLVGINNQASTFLLSQSMGGGKTHNMIALGLLARYPRLRKAFWKDKDLGSSPVRVIGFDGRESDYKFGIWGALADQLGKKELFSDLYSPLQPPGVSSWQNLLQGETTIILLDELPPYFVQAKAKKVGDSNLADLTTTAISNLMVAANRDELSNVVIVISDLSGSAYADTGMIKALDDLNMETKRSVLTLEPVAAQGEEVYHILRTRLFEKLPDLAVRDEVAVAYAEAAKKAKQMDLTAASPEAFASELRESYPLPFLAAGPVRPLQVKSRLPADPGPVAPDARHRSQPVGNG
jgi:predicted AAA+ superfamily ATPase